MEAEERYATPRQMAYIERLSTDSGTTIDKPLADLTVTEASELIQELVDKVNNGQNRANSTAANKQSGRRNDFGSGARLGMAFKCVYRNWVTGGLNIFTNKKDFIKNVLDTYQLINEIAEKALETDV